MPHPRWHNWVFSPRFSFLRPSASPFSSCVSPPPRASALQGRRDELFPNFQYSSDPRPPLYPPSFIFIYSYLALVIFFAFRLWAHPPGRLFCPCYILRFFHFAFSSSVGVLMFSFLYLCGWLLWLVCRVLSSLVFSAPIYLPHSQRWPLIAPDHSNYE